MSSILAKYPLPVAMNPKLLAFLSKFPALTGGLEAIATQIPVRCFEKEEHLCITKHVINFIYLTKPVANLRVATWVWCALWCGAWLWWQIIFPCLPAYWTR